MHDHLIPVSLRVPKTSARDTEAAFPLLHDEGGQHEFVLVEFVFEFCNNLCGDGIGDVGDLVGAVALALQTLLHHLQRLLADLGLDLVYAIHQINY